ncbi:hypothetical protein M433DRAFT_75664 [Acidomyces richmondensis BFW]|nr:hypothetical protein M433DRAFT_75664 [Acidomyces richmondensis BFW]
MGVNGKMKSSTLPLDHVVDLTSITGPTYLTIQTLVQQVAYSLSDKLFTYSPETFDLDTAAKKWSATKEPNAYGEVTGVQAMQTRHGAGSIALGYVFSPDFDLNRRHVPQSIIASTASLRYLRTALDQLSLLYDVANPTAIQVAAVDYAAESRAGLVTDYSSALDLAEDIGLGLVSSRSAQEAQHMALFSTLLASIVPSVHIYDGITVGREMTRVVDAMSVSRLAQTYASVCESIKDDLPSKRLTNEGKLLKLMQTFNVELGTDYRCFEYHGHATPMAVLVVFGTVEASLAAQVAEALARQDVRVGVINVRVYRPFAEDDFWRALPVGVQQVTVLGQVQDQTGVRDSSISSSLFADVMAAINFRRVTSGPQPRVFDIKYSPETVWTVAKMEALLRKVSTKPGETAEQQLSVRLAHADVEQYVFWDVDFSETVDTPIMLAQLLSDDSSVNVTARIGHDNLVQGGTVRTDVRCSAKSIEAPYSVYEADISVVAETKLLKEFSVVRGIKDEGILLLRCCSWKEDEVEKILSPPVRKAVAAKRISLFVIDPAASVAATEDTSLENWLLQLAFLKLARPKLYESGLGKLNSDNSVLPTLAKDLNKALKKIEVPESWLALDLGGEEASKHAQDFNINSFVPFSKEDDQPPSQLRNCVPVAKALAFKEAYGTTSALRPDLGVKTATVYVKEHRRLTPPTYDRNIFHIEFDLGESGLAYEIGEALGIHAENDEMEVKKFIEWYGLNADDVVEVASREDSSVLESRTVYQALMQNVDIFGRPPKRFYEALSEFATDPKEKNELLMLGTGGNQEAVVEFKRRAEVDTITYADILLEFPSAHPSFHDIVRIVNPMKRREYSVASSQKVTPNSISLLIVTVAWTDPKGRDRFGQATRYLNSLPIGAPVTVSVKPSVMKLPPKTTQPIIMAGLGTGLAPFRAFVQERAWQRQQGMPIGDVFLYMGSRHQREEYLYGEEWEAYQDAGIITLLGRAFSRDQPQKIYIQDRMRETLADIRRAYLREEGAFYLCGPTWPVPDVTAVLEEAVVLEAAAEGKRKDGSKEIERLKEDLRYVLEVY